MQYTDLTTALVILFEDNDALGVYTFVDSPDFSTYLPNIIQQAELRCYREICPLAARAAPANGSTTPGSRTLDLTGFTPLPIAVEGIALITPNGSAPAAGTRWQYRKATLDFIDTIWPTEATTAPPSANPDQNYYAYLDAMTIVLAPTPDLAYFVEAPGTTIPAPLSMVNPQTYLSINYPDVFLYACAVETAAFHKHYGAQSDDPKVALSFESGYQEKKIGALEEEHRRRGTNGPAISLPSSAAAPHAPPMPMAAGVPGK